METYRLVNKGAWCYSGVCADKRVRSGTYGKINSNLLVNTDTSADSKVKSYLVVGYSLGFNLGNYSFSENSLSSYPEDVFVRTGRIKGKESLNYEGRIGFQVKSSFMERHELTIGVVSEFGWINRWGISYSEFIHLRPFLRISRRK